MASLSLKFMIKENELLNKDKISKILSLDYNYNLKNRWVYEVYIDDSVDVNELLKILLDILNPKKTLLINLKKDYNLDYALKFDLSPDERGNPDIFFTKNDFDLFIDIDCDIEINQEISENDDDWD
ncbi:DUF4279 domain-containing protein [Peptostreptococcaceae bacterium AGR-M142]